MGQVWLMRVEARTVRRLNSFRSSQSPALQMSSSDFRVPGDHFLHVLCKKKKEREREKELAECQHCRPSHGSLSSWQILYFPKNMELWSHDLNHEQDGSEFSKLRWDALEHYRPSPKGGWVSVPNWERGACDQAEMTTKRHLGLTFCHSLPGEFAQCVVSQDTAASFPGSSKEEDTVQGEWCVAPWAPPPSPALPLLRYPAPCLTRGTLPLDHRSSCTPLLLQSCFCSLQGRHM